MTDLFTQYISKNINATLLVIFYL